jgi:hypothetical protein
MLTVTYCGALCINLFFGWPNEKSWNLGDWVDANVVKHIPKYENAFVYSNEDENVGVRVTKSTTINGCAKYIIKVTKIYDSKPTKVHPGTLTIRNYCAE